MLTTFTTKSVFAIFMVMAALAAVAFAPEIIIDNTQPVVVIVRPTTASPNYTNQSSPNFEVVFNYTEANPNNWSLRIYNATHTVCTHRNTSALSGGTNVTVTTNCSVAGAAAGEYNLSVNMTDIVLNSSVDVETSAIIVDFAIPTLSGPVPANNSNVNTTRITLGINTSEVATCRFNTAPDTDYYAMPYTFANTQATVHNSTINLTDFGIYNFYLRCRDNAGNVNQNDFWISVNFVSNLTVFGRSVTMNLALRVGSNKSNDVLKFSANYSAVDNLRNGTVAAIVSGGPRPFAGSVNTSYSSAANLISASQAADGSVFFLVMTNGSVDDIAARTYSLGSGKLPSGLFGVMYRGTAASFPLHVVAEYDSVDIANNTPFSGSGEILIRNRGPVADGRQNITIERVT